MQCKISVLQTWKKECVENWGSLGGEDHRVIDKSSP